MRRGHTKYFLLCYLPPHFVVTVEIRGKNELQLGAEIESAVLGKTVTNVKIVNSSISIQYRGLPLAIDKVGTTRRSAEVLSSVLPCRSFEKRRNTEVTKSDDIL